MIDSLVLPVCVSLLACCLIMATAWFWSYKTKNAGIVEVFWSLNFSVIAIVLFVTSDGWHQRLWLICAMMIVWGVRHGIHLGRRLFGHLDKEESLYEELREDWAPHAERNLFWFFQTQGISNVILSVPFFIISVNSAEEFSLFEYFGTALWLFALSFEIIADWQLDQFEKNPDNKGKVCQVGFWKNSRHPNYFFEWLIWMSYAIFALGSPHGYLGIISAAVILDLLLNVSGIPVNEKQAISTKGELYKDYQRTTNGFIPWFRKI